MSHDPRLAAFREGFRDAIELAIKALLFPIVILIFVIGALAQLIRNLWRWPL